MTRGRVQTINWIPTKIFGETADKYHGLIKLFLPIFSGGVCNHQRNLACHRNLSFIEFVNDQSHE